MYILREYICLYYKLVEMKNKLAISHKLIIDKIVNHTHSHSAFSKYICYKYNDR